MNNSGIANLVCNGSVAEVADRLEALLKTKGMKVFARLDQAAEARAAGLTMRPMVLLLFGNPKAGTPLMIEHPSLAIDLPLKALVWESADGKTLLSYNSPEFLQQRHSLGAPPFEAVGSLLRLASQQ
jgi:uncharacterized protein (DUF302 family)